MSKRNVISLLTVLLILAAVPVMAQNAEDGGDGEQPRLVPAETNGDGGDATDGAGDDGAATDGDGGGDGDGAAENGEQGVDDQQVDGEGGGAGSWLPLVVLIGAFFLLYFWMGRSRRKQEAKRKEMLAQIKKGDKVTSIGGIVGTIMDVREDEVVVKVDETNNVRMRFARWAVRGVGEDAKQEKPEDNK